MPARSIRTLALALLLPFFGAVAQDEPTTGSPFIEAYRAALTSYKNGDYKAARTEAAAAAKLKSDSVQAGARLKLLQGRIALEFGEFSVAEKFVKEGLEADPDYAYAYQYLGDVYFHKKEYGFALDYYQQFLQHKPKDPDGVLKIVYCNVGRKDLSAAGKALLQLDQFSDVHPGYYLAKSAISRATGKKESADKDLQLARTMYGNEAFALYMKTYLLLYPDTKL